ncbi:MAG TPA: DUF6766 family protein [Gaiellaceae bacterium]|jgi:hypothetical protein
MRRFLFEHGLSVFFGTLFLLTLVAQSLVGQHAFNADQAVHGSPAVSWRDYVLSPEFGGAVLENWQSEFLQFTLFIVATVWLVQKGSAESKRPDSAGLESKQAQRLEGFAPENAPRWSKLRDWRRVVYENSLLLAMGTIFFGTWLGQSLNNWRSFNAEQLQHHEAAVSWGRYLLDADFWERTLQNWQSEFLAVGTMAVFTIYLRQRGSPESKPVGTPHHETDSSD